MTRRISKIDHEKLSAEIASLDALGVNELRERWKRLYGTQPPPRISRDLLRCAVAYRIQERVLGGIKPSTRRLLERVAADARARRPLKVVTTRKVGAGTVLLREWSGVSHQVSVLEDGVLFSGKRYRSLSEVARRITGSRWSGPLFFGLKAPAKEASGDGAW